MRYRRLISICLIMAIASSLLLLVGCRGDLSPERTDAQRFKDEYETINGEDAKEGKLFRELNFAEDNPILYTTYAEVSEMMHNGETFVLYCGFPTCPWCRASISTFLKCAEENGIDKVYYLDLFYSRDIWEYTEEGLENTREADPDYLTLMDDMGDILDDYIIKDLDGNEHFMEEKRIYAPNYIAVVDGKAVSLEETGDRMEDPYGELGDEVISELTERYNELFKLVK